jgi:hypothetical protein
MCRVERKFGGMSVAHMVGFGFKQAWLALREPAGDVGEICAALGANDLGTVDWQHGIDLAYLTDNRIAVTPALSGVGGVSWTLVVGRLFFVDTGMPDIVELSGRLGTEVQFFATHRVVEAHFWERAVEGKLVRSFRYVGETGEITRWYGEPDATELAIGLPPTFDTEAEPEDQPNIVVDEDDVMTVAAAWSLDPTELDGRSAPGPIHVAAR